MEIYRVTTVCELSFLKQFKTILTLFKNSFEAYVELERNYTMNDEEKVRINVDKLTELMDKFGSHRRLASEIKVMYERGTVTTQVSESTIYRMTKSDQQSSFKVRDIRAVAYALNSTLEEIANTNRPGFRSIECIAERSGQAMYEKIVKADIIDLKLDFEPEDTETHDELIKLTELIGALHNERGAGLVSLKEILEDKLALKASLTKLAPSVNILLGVGEQLLIYDNEFDYVEGRHGNGGVSRRKFDPECYWVYDERMAKWERLGGGVSFAKILFIRVSMPTVESLTEQIELDPGELSETGPIDRVGVDLLRVENISREFWTDKAALPDVRSLQTIDLNEICSAQVRIYEAERREKEKALSEELPF